MNTKKIVKKRLAFGAIIFLLYMITYFVCRYFPGENYTPEWTARHFLVIAAIISLIPVCFGWIKFSFVSYVGYLIGILTGEIFGGFQSDIPPQYLHWGWLICIMVFLSSCVIGITFELKKKSERIDNRQG